MTDKIKFRPTNGPSSRIDRRTLLNGWEISEPPGPIIRLPAMNQWHVAKMKARLLSAGIYPPFLKYPGASAQGFFRFVISSEHSRAQLDKLILALADLKNAAKLSEPQP